MPLTPEDVSNKRFTPVRLREGYDMGEVDRFLDEVEAELERLTKESDDMRATLGRVSGDGGSASSGLEAKPEHRSAKSSSAVVEKTASSEAVERSATGAAAQSSDRSSEPGPAAAAAARETIKVVTPAEASSAALRLLELATKNADEVVAEATQEAEQIVGTARTEAERLEAETKARTESLEAETKSRADGLEQQARSRAQNLDSETESKRRDLLGGIEREKSRLDAEVDTLRSFEREYRSRLKNYFAEQLAALDEPGQSDGEGVTPGRLASILGERGGESGHSTGARLEGDEHREGRHENGSDRPDKDQHDGGQHHQG